MSEKIAVITFSWILSWSFTAVKQLSITYDYLTNNQSNVQVVTNTPTDVDENVSAASTSKQTYSKTELHINDCKDKMYWDKVSLEISEDKNKAYINFPKPPAEQGIKTVSLNVHPMNSTYDRNFGFRFHGISERQLSLTQKVQEVDLQVLKHNQGEDFVWFVELIGKDSNFNNCFSDSISTLTLETFNNFVNVQPAYKPNVFNPADELYFRVSSFEEEQEFFKHYFYNLELKKQNQFLPPPSEVGLALLEQNVNELDGPYVDYSIDGRHRLHGEVVVGLFGDVKQSDLITMSNMIKTLHIVAPQLNIKYSDHAESVNLPIHFVPCTEYFSDKAYKCKNKALGTYHFPRKYFYVKEQNVLGEFGWIWIDSQRSAELRSHVLVHEFAHALGLLHNKCHDSSVSYNTYAPEIAHFSVLDLMQLRVLYDPNLKVLVNSKQVLRDLDLDEEKYLKYKDNNSTKSLCHEKQGGWSDVIDFQLGLLDYELNEGGNSA